MMELHTNITEARANHTTACLQCGKCMVIQRAKEIVSKPETKAEINSLYGAEALAYYFHFSPATVAKAKS